MKNLKNNCEQLISAGLDPKTPAAVTEWGSYPFQRNVVGTVQGLAFQAEVAGIQAPAVVVVGEVVGLQPRLSWRETLSLWGKKILLTRSRSDNLGLKNALKDLGAWVLELPCVELKRLDDPHWPEDWERFRWIVFTSAHAVDFFFARWREKRLDIRRLSSTSIASVGPKTSARLGDYQLSPSLEAKPHHSEALASTLSPLLKSGDNVLLPTARHFNEKLVADLEREGAAVQVLPVYENRLPERAVEIPDPDLICAASASALRNLLILKGERYRDFPLLALGPSTAAAASEFGFREIRVAEEATEDRWLEAILEFFTPLNG